MKEGRNLGDSTLGKSNGGADVRFPLTPNSAQNRRFFLFFLQFVYFMAHFYAHFFRKNGEEMGQNPLFRGKNGEEMGKFFEVVNQPSDSEIITAIVSLNRPTRNYITGKRIFQG